MCGIIGLLSAKPEDALVERAALMQAHRGPDARGQEVARVSSWNVHFAHQRLSIIDLDEAASQPFSDKSGEYLLTYNGEIYNYLEIREKLEKEGVEFRTKSDTEVLLNSILSWGLDRTLKEVNGMFAFLFLDKIHQKLFAVRDRYGIKPLYFAHGSQRVAFSSEIKACLELWQQKVGINKTAVANYLRQNLLEIDKVNTFFEDIHKVEPGCFLVFDLNRTELKPTSHRYYEIDIEPNQSMDFTEATQEYQRLLSDAVELRLRSDVPVGVMLSGGIDSSTLASLAVDYCGNKGLATPRLLSVVSDDIENDESPFIDIMSSYLNQSAEKIKLDFGPERFFELMRAAHWHNDEPLTSFSAIGHFEMMRKSAQTDSIVLLCGQGADEALGGYKKYVAFAIQSLLNRGQFIQAGALAIGFLKNGSILNAYSFKDAKRYLPSWMRSAKVSVLSEELAKIPSCYLGLGQKSFAHRSQLDIERFSVPILLHIEDRLSMAHSREIRVPFLDHRVVEFTLNLPLEMKLSGGWTKKVLRNAFEHKLPAEITWRKDKRGFTLPQDEWLKGELQPKISQIFSSNALMYESGLVDKGDLTRIYDQYLRNENDWQISYKDIFSPLSVETWLEQFQQYIK